VLDVLCDDDESTRRKSGDRVEEAGGLGAVEGRVGLRSLRVVNWEAADWSRTDVSGLRGSSGRGGRGRDLDEGESLALLLLFGACVSECWSTVLKKLEDATMLGSWVAGGIPVSRSGDNGDDISTVGRLAWFGVEVSIAGVNRVGTRMSTFPVDG
jgi:hypothetical protein